MGKNIQHHVISLDATITIILRLDPKLIEAWRMNFPHSSFLLPFPVACRVRRYAPHYAALPVVIWRILSDLSNIRTHLKQTLEEKKRKKKEKS